MSSITIWELRSDDRYNVDTRWQASASLKFIQDLERNFIYIYIYLIDKWKKYTSFSRNQRLIKLTIVNIAYKSKDIYE